MRLLAAGLTTLLLGLLLVPAVRAFARRVGMVAAPRKDRWHSQPTALLGGVGIFVAFALGLVLFPEAADDAVPVLIASALLFVVGLVDDVVQIRPLLKLSLQVGAAAIVVGTGIHLPWTHQPLVDGAITMLWLVGITNAVNLLDNMDGLAAGISAIACVFLCVTFVLNGQVELAVLPALVCGAALGFLRYNFKPASIFMGDGGSMFLGSLLGGLALLSSYGRSRSVASVLLTPVLIMAIPILDTTLVTVTRRLRGQPVSQGGRDHTSHRLVALGASERRAVVLLYLIAAVSGGLALAVRGLQIDAILAIVPAFGLLMLLIAFHLNAALTFSTQGSPLPEKPRRRWVMELAIDMILASISYLAAYLMRWDGEIPPSQWAILLATLPLVLAIEAVGLALGGMYRTWWRHPRVEDLIVIGRATIVGAVAAGVVVLCLYQFHGPSRGVLMLNVILLLVLVTASRLGFRLLDVVVAPASVAVPGATPVLIYGVSERAVMLLRAIGDGAEHRRTAVGFLDDSTAERHRRAHGLPVFGSAELPSLLADGRVGEVVLSEGALPDSMVGALRDLGIPICRLQVELSRVA